MMCILWSSACHVNDRCSEAHSRKEWIHPSAKFNYLITQITIWFFWRFYKATTKKYIPDPLYRGSTQKEVISDMKRENKFLSKEIWQFIWLISLERSVNRFWSLILSSHSMIKSLSEFVPIDIIKKGNWAKQHHIYSNFVTVHCTVDIALLQIKRSLWNKPSPHYSCFPFPKYAQWTHFST